MLKIHDKILKKGKGDIMNEFVVIKNLIKNYGDFCAVDNLSFSVEKGEIFGLLGPNGAGKSTTLNAITMLSDFSKGEISIDGMNIKTDYQRIKMLIGIVPQKIALYDHLTAIENVKFFASLYGLKGKALLLAAKEALGFVNLSEKSNLKPRQMSGGMLRRLNIACGIAHSPKLIIMDEPTVGVDTQSREHILESIKILRSRGATIIYTSHYMNEVEEICDTIAIIDKGRLIASGTKEELVSLVTNLKTVKIQTILNSDFNKDSFIKQMSALTHVKHIRIQENDVIKIDLSLECDDLTFIFDKISEFGLPFISVNSDVPDLDTLFIALTGKEIR